MTSWNTGSPEAHMFLVRVEQIEGTAFLQLCGQLDLAGIHDVKAAFDQAFDLGPVVVDLRSLTFIDSTGLGVLISAAKARAEAGKSPVQFIRGSEQVQRVFEITQADSLLEWLDVC